jgi:hypothetical protein
MLSMGSILIRKVPDVVHRKFKLACRARKVSMEETIVRLIAREVGEGKRGRPRTLGSKRRATSARRAASKPVKRNAKKSPRKTTRKAVRRPVRAGRRGTTARRSKTRG